MFLRNERRQNTSATTMTLRNIGLNESQTSIKSNQNEYKRNLSRGMSHFGAAAVAAANNGSSPKISTPKIGSNHLIVGLIPKVNSQLRGVGDFSDILKNDRYQYGYSMSEEESLFDLLKEYTIYYP